MQGAQVVPKPNDDEIHLRGIYATYPTRVVVDPFWSIAIDVKAPNQQQRTLTVRFDPESAPAPGDVSPWDEDDEVRVFLAKCVFVEDSASEIEQTLRLVQSLPADFRGHLFHLMQIHQLSSVNLTGDGPGTSFRNDLGAMWDPMTQLGQALWLVAYGASVYAALPPPAGAAEVQGGFGGASAHRAKCRFCGTLFLLGAGSACPNCGANYTG